MLELTVISFNGEPTDIRPVSFGPAGGTVGRAEGTDLTLPDPLRAISRIHARIVHGGDGYAIVKEGAYPIVLNGEPLESGQEAKLRDGDELQIGGYSIAVSSGDATEPQSRSAVTTTSHARSAATDRLSRAFRDGLGMPELRLVELDAERMRLVGALLREATRGAVELLQARAAVKSEMRVERTMLGAQGNNPLKFSPSVEVAVQFLLGEPTPGFMEPVPAMRDAFDDLRAHQLGMMAGMRAALEGVLGRFDPAVLEKQIARRSSLGGLIPSSRKARLWELFQEMYAQLSQQALDDFDDLFAAAFRRAYEAQIERLKHDD